MDVIEADPPTDVDEYTLVLLVRPPNAPELDAAEADRLQRQHLGYLEEMNAFAGSRAGVY